MTRAVVSVATTPMYQKGQRRLIEGVARHSNPRGEVPACVFFDREPNESPRHADVPYAMKAYALKQSAPSYDLLLWCDSSVVPIRSLEPLWERIERDGYWMSNNGYTNYEWTAESAYPDLFREEWTPAGAYLNGDRLIDHFRGVNRRIPHVVATAFGLNVRHPLGKAFLDEYYRLASETRAFCGPWTNANYGAPTPDELHKRMSDRCYICGPPDVRGHRHDQTAASVIAWRLGFKLTNAPDVFAYGKMGVDQFDKRTILVADGSVFA